VLDCELFSSILEARVIAGHELIDAPAGYGSRRSMTPGSLD
jgi:hypothetical protein